MAAWQSAFDSIPEPTPDDQLLFSSAMWIAIQSKDLRDRWRNPELAELGAELVVILAVAAANREFRTASQLSAEANTRAQEKGAMAIDHLMSQPLDGAMPGQILTSSALTEIVTDAAESWLFDAYRLPASGTKAPSDLSTIVKSASLRYSIQHGLNDLWNQCLWEGWHIDVDMGHLTWVPGDRGFATLVQAWLARQESNFMSYPWIDMSAWVIAPPEVRRRMAPYPTVTDITYSFKRKIKTGWPSYRSKKMPTVAIEIAGIEGSYLSEFLDASFISEPALNIRILLRAWNVIADLASKLISRLKHVVFPSEDDERALSLLVSHSELIATLTSSLRIEKSIASAIVVFLTFKLKKSGDKGHRGLWASPLVPIPGTNNFALPLGCLSTSATLRKVEAWLERGGIDDQLKKGARGDIFESNLRSEINASLQGNKVLSDVRCTTHGIERSSIFPEQIDIIFGFGNLLFVGEIKFHLTPADSIERHYHFQKLKSAAEQAIRKADAVRNQPDFVASIFNITTAKARQFRVIPIVINNQGFGLSLNFGACRITESRFLLTCLGSGTIMTQSALTVRTGRQTMDQTTLYSTQAEAEAEIENILAKPVVLEYFKDRISWRKSSFPTSYGDPLSIDTPVLDDFKGRQLEFGRLAMSLDE